MISVEEAKQLVLQHTTLSDAKLNVATIHACDFVLALPVTAPIDLPPFRQSSVDGYAVNLTSFHSVSTGWKIQNEIKAGEFKRGNYLLVIEIANNQTYDDTLVEKILHKNFEE